MKKKNCGMGTENVPISGAGGMCQRRRRSQFFFSFAGSVSLFLCLLYVHVYEKKINLIN